MEKTDGGGILKITWLGQNGLLIEGRECTVMADPYLSDALFEAKGERCRRNFPVQKDFLDIHPDLLLLTHDHSDHTDMTTLRAVLDCEKSVDVICSANAWKKVRGELGGAHNYVSVYPGTEWTCGNVHVRAVTAVHSDESALGFIISMDGKTVYITGDTLYDERIISDVRDPVDIMLTVVNGRGNNMNYLDAARMVRKIKPKLAVPVHWGLFASDTTDPELFMSRLGNGIRAVKLPVFETLDSAELLEEKNDE